MTFPVKDGARCGYCNGPVNIFGCVNRCAGSRENLVQWPRRDESAEDRLATIHVIAEGILSSRRPEFVDREWAMVYELAKGTS